MNDDELYRLYRKLTDPAPRWRRWPIFILPAIVLVGCAVTGCILNAAVRGPLWALAIGVAAGLLVGGWLVRSGFNLPRAGLRRSLSIFGFYLALFASEHLILWLAHAQDSTAFFLAYTMAIMVGGAVGAILFGCSSLARESR